MSAFGPPPLQTAPSPTFSPPLAFGGFWFRFVAWMIDGFLLQLVTSLVAVAAGFKLDPETFDIQGNTPLAVSAALVIPAAYWIGFWTYFGATPGKMPFKMRIVRFDTGGPITLGQAIIRYVGSWLSAIVFLLGYVWIAFDPRKQGWHDKLAATVVVRELDMPPIGYQPGR